MSQTFKRNIENFTCLHCGAEVIGNGYTNHCPKCLWSQHVDINPGDRAATCKGLMKPVKVENIKGEWIITHQCIICNYEKKNKMSPEDDMEKAVVIVKKLSSSPEVHK